MVPLGEKSLAPQLISNHFDYLEPLLLITFELSASRILLTREVSKVWMFFAEMGGVILLLYMICMLMANIFSSHFTWVNHSRVKLVEKQFKIEYNNN